MSHRLLNMTTAFGYEIMTIRILRCRILLEGVSGVIGSVDWKCKVRYPFC